jgi:hypothetical protein
LVDVERSTMVDLTSPIVELVGFALLVLVGLLLTARH